MTFTARQEVRLRSEAKWLKPYFPDHALHETPEGFCFRGSMATNCGARFEVSVMLEDDFPNSPPVVVVTDPVPLLDTDGVPMVNASTSMHTLDAVGGQTQICHSSCARWNPSDTVYKALMKARIWLEAYMEHRRGGSDIDDYLPHQE